MSLKRPLLPLLGSSAIIIIPIFWFDFDLQLERGFLGKKFNFIQNYA